MMATTIMISTSVKPARRGALAVFIWFLYSGLTRREQHNRRVTMIAMIVHKLPAATVSDAKPAMPMP